jgi:hypothetical protein
MERVKWCLGEVDFRSGDPSCGLSSGGCRKATPRGAAKRLREGGNAVILGGYRNDRVVFRAGPELLAYVWHGCAGA